MYHIQQFSGPKIPARVILNLVYLQFQREACGCEVEPDEVIPRQRAPNTLNHLGTSSHRSMDE